MADPTVKLKIEGDSSDAVSAMEKVGASSDQMATQVRSSGASFDRASDGIDNTGQKAGDLESGFRGITDSAAGFAQIAQGDVMAGLTDLAGGAEALAFGLRGVVVPAMRQAVTWLGRTRVGMLAQAAAARVARVATIAWATAQRVLNAVLRASPFGRVATLIGIVVAAVTLLWVKSEGLRRVVGRVWDWIWGKVKAVAGWISRVAGGVWNGLTSGINAAWRAIKGVFDKIVAGVSWVKDQVKGLWSSITGVSDSAQSMVDRVMGSAGGRLPQNHTGGVIPGTPGSDVPRMMQAGERVIPAGKRDTQSGGTVTLRSDGSAFSDLVLATVRKAIRQQGGDVQVVLGRR